MIAGSLGANEPTLGSRRLLRGPFLARKPLGEKRWDSIVKES